MNTITCPKIIIVATAALAATPAALALVTQHVHSSRLSPPSLLKLGANQQPFSELDNLRTKRLALRRRLPEPEAELAVQGHDAEDVSNESLVSDLELDYLYDAKKERNSDELFHIILMPSTFQDDRMSIEHAAESCIEVLGIPSDKAQDLSLFAKHQGFSCLGTWSRDECLSIGEELINHDLDCRVIPVNDDYVPDDVPESIAVDEETAATRAIVGDALIWSEGLPKMIAVDEDIDAQKALVEEAFLLSTSG